MQNTRVRNLFSTILGVGVVAGGLVLSSCEDEFTEQDAIKAQQETLAALDQQDFKQELEKDSLARIGPVVNYTVTVVSGKTANFNGRTAAEAFASGAMVKVTQGGTTVEGTTDEAGIANFGDLRIGDATVTIMLEGHTTATYTTSLGSPSFELKEDNVETTIPIFPTTLEAGASEVSGTAWAEMNTLNDMPELAVGAKVRATISVSNALDSYGINVGNTGKGDIKSATYSDFVQTATVGDDGRYTLIIPNGNADNGAGIPHTIEFLPFTGMQTYVKAQGDTLAVVEEEVVFSNGSSTNHISTGLPSVYAVIEDPASKAEGFTVMAKANRTVLSSSEVKVLDRGTGYEVGDKFVFAADADGQTASLTVATIEDPDGDSKGPILTLSGIANDEDGDFTSAEYDAAPAVSQDAGNDGTGATLFVEFVTSYDLVVENGGSGYVDVPSVNLTYKYYDTDGNIVSTVNSNYTINAEVVNGQIRAEGGTTLETTGNYAAKPVIDVKNPIIVKPEVRSVNVSSNGEVQSVSFDNSGSGYAKQPSIMFKSVGEGMGSGASGIVILSGGTINSVSISNGGSGYMRFANQTGSYANPMSLTASQSNYQRVEPGVAKVNHNYSYGIGDRRQ